MWLEASDVFAPLQDDIVLSVNEAVTNAIQHAEDCDSIAIRASIESGLLTIDVTDTGGWKEPQAVADDESGRGLILIRALIEHVEIRPSSGGTTVHLRQPLS